MRDNCQVCQVELDASRFPKVLMSREEIRKGLGVVAVNEKHVLTMCHPCLDRVEANLLKEER